MDLPPNRSPGRLSPGPRRHPPLGHHRAPLPLSGIRGKLDLASSIKANLFKRALAVCESDELSHNVTHNRILKSTIRNLRMTPDISVDLREKLAETYYRMGQIAEIDINDRSFRAVQLHRNNARYRLLMDVCRLIHKASLVNEDNGETEFREFIRDERRMRILFERFVRNFYRREQTEFKVVGNHVRWAHLRGDADSLKLIPGMRTDIHLASLDRRIVIDTKFVPKIMQERFAKATLRSSHLYQLFTYLVNLRQLQGPRPEGILLYPTSDAKRDLQYRIDGQAFRVFTLDLNEPWRAIRDDLLSLLRKREESPNPPEI